MLLVQYSTVHYKLRLHTPSLSLFGLLILHFFTEQFQFLVLLGRFRPPLEFGRLVVQHHQVPSSYIETGKVIDGIFGIVNVLVHDKGRAARVLVLIAQADLVHGPVFTKYGVQFVRGDVEWQISDVQDAIHLGRQFGLSVVDCILVMSGERAGHAEKIYTVINTSNKAICALHRKGSVSQVQRTAANNPGSFLSTTSRYSYLCCYAHCQTSAVLQRLP
jgi:hypothetical protein